MHDQMGRRMLTMNRTVAIWGDGKNLGKTLMAWAVEYPLLFVRPFHEDLRTLERLRKSPVQHI